MSEVDRARRARERGDGRTWRERALEAEARLAKVSALVEALREITTGEWDDLDPDDGLHATSVRAFARESIATWESD